MVSSVSTLNDSYLIIDGDKTVGSLIRSIRLKVP